jgi:hypothetical protein
MSKQPNKCEYQEGPEGKPRCATHGVDLIHPSIPHVTPHEMNAPDAENTVWTCPESGRPVSEPFKG